MVGLEHPTFRLRGGDVTTSPPNPLVPGADLGGGVGFADALFSRIRPPLSGIRQNFQKKVPKNAFFWPVFFQNFACGAENLAKTGSLQCFGRAQKINLIDLKKVDKIFEIFLKIHPPREIPPPLDPPLLLSEIIIHIRNISFRLQF